MRRELVSGLVLVAIACLCGSAVATDYFVATDGDDSWPGTISQPFRTITKGTSVAVAGDTINVRAGSYAESRLDFYSDGTAGNPITLLSYDGDHAAHITDGIYIHARAYIDIIGMQVSGSTYNLHIDPGDGLTPRSQYINVIRCYFHGSEGTPGCCVKANQSDYVILEDCEIGGTSDKCLDWVWVTYSEVRRNYWHDYLDYGLMNKGGSMYGIVEDTVVVNALDSVTKALKFGGTTDRKYRNPDSDYATQYTVYRNNIIRECEGGATCTYECWYAYFYHNTVHNCGAEPGRGIVVHHADRPTTGDGGSRNLFFYNNIFMDTDGDMGEVYEDQSGKPYENWQHDYNNYWNAGNPIPTSGLFDPNEEANSTFGNPNLANPTGTATTRAGWLDCYRITSSSTSLIDQGSSTAGDDPRPAVHDDIEGNSRPQGSGYDIGAFEYTGGGPSAPVAEFSGNPTSGPPTLTVYFTDLSTGSPTSWDWTFGDGGTSSAEDPSHDYTTENTYTVSLTVENSVGQDTETKVDYITVVDQSCHVGAIDMFDDGPPDCIAGATVTVHDQDCTVLAGVTVEIEWSGAVTGTDSDVTDEYGQVTFSSDRNKDGGTFTCCVTNLTKSGYPYQSGDNHETCDSITLP